MSKYGLIAKAAGGGPSRGWYEAEPGFYPSTMASKPISPKKYAVKISKLEDQNADLAAANEAWKRYFVSYATHKDSCMIKELQEVGRLSRMKDCSCGLASLIRNTRGMNR